MRQLEIGPHALMPSKLPRYPGVYLICFDQPCTSADGRRVTRHYLGWAANIRQRIEHHQRNVSGSKFMSYVNLMGVTYRVTHLWLDATRADERRLKKQKHAWRLCPRCNPSLRGGAVTRLGTWQGVLPFAAAELVMAAAAAGRVDDEAAAAREASAARWREANMGGAVLDICRGWSSPGAA